MLYVPRPHQIGAINRLVNTPHCALFAKAGAGKTSILLAVLKILRAQKELRRCLLIAPLQTCLTSWPAEIEKWDQFRYLEFHHPEQGLGDGNAFITAVNPERTKLLTKAFCSQFDCLVIDESTKYQNWSAKRVKHLKPLLPLFRRRHIMTGTPTPSTLESWFSQQYVVDLGDSFGRYITHFRERFFDRRGYKYFTYTAKPGALEQLVDIASPHLCIAEPAAGDMPNAEVVDRFVRLPESVRPTYKSMERELFAALSSETVTAASKGVAYGKCRQIAAGALYTQDKKYEVLHREKSVNAARLIDELNGEPALVMYHRSFEAEMLKNELNIPTSQVAEIRGKTSKAARETAISRWNAGELRVLLMHPATGAHGLNLQDGGHNVIWLTLPDDPELYEQGSRRMQRLMAKNDVTIYRIIVKGTIETVVKRRIETRCELQKALLDYCSEQLNSS